MLINVMHDLQNLKTMFFNKSQSILCDSNTDKVSFLYDSSLKLLFRNKPCLLLGRTTDI